MYVSELRLPRERDELCVFHVPSILASEPLRRLAFPLLCSDLPQFGPFQFALSGSRRTQNIQT